MKKQSKQEIVRNEFFINTLSGASSCASQSSASKVSQKPLASHLQSLQESLHEVKLANRNSSTISEASQSAASSSCGRPTVELAEDGSEVIRIEVETEDVKA